MRVCTEEVCWNLFFDCESCPSNDMDEDEYEPVEEPPFDGFFEWLMKDNEK